MTDRTVGIFGLGIMGGAISRNLIERGWAVVGFDTDPSRRSELERVGVTIVDSAGSVASHSAMTMTSLPKADAANAGVTEADNLRFKAILELAGHIALDCPPSGTGAQAAVRDLVV